MEQISHGQADAILKEFISTLKLTLTDELVGVYLYGSLATDEFVEGQSDIDLLVILQKNISQKTLDLLIGMHRQFNSEHTSWQDRIDIAYVSQSALWNFLTKPYKAIISDDKNLLTIVDALQYYLIDWHKVQEHGVSLFGLEVNEVMPHITANEFKRTMHEYMQTYAESAKSAKKRGEQAYVIVTMCRSLYAYKFAKHVSKKFGSQWAMDEYPQWRELIQRGLDWNRNKEVDAIVDKKNQKEVIGFVSFVLCEAQQKNIRNS